MASSPKQKYSSIGEQENLLHQFYDELDNDDEVSLGRRFSDYDTGIMISGSAVPVIIVIMRK